MKHVSNTRLFLRTALKTIVKSIENGVYGADGQRRRSPSAPHSKPLPFPSHDGSGYDAEEFLDFRTRLEAALETTEALAASQDA